MSDLHGLLVALITPFTDDQKHIDADRLKTHINRLIAAGIHRLIPGGSTSKFTTLTATERKELTELCIKFAAGHILVIVSTGSTSTAEAVELATHTASAGATALMVVPPFYDPVNLEQLTELMSEIHSALGLPIMYYNIPSTSGLTLTPSEIAGLSKVGVKYLKDTSGNAPAFTELVFGLLDKIIAFNGWDTLTFYSLTAGCPSGV